MSHKFLISTSEAQKITKYKHFIKFKCLVECFFSTLVAYIALFITMLCVKQLQDYKILIVLFSITIAFTTIGVDWVYNIYEEYYYITVRSISFQVLSLLLLFILVKKQEDYSYYALITVISNIGSNIFNFVHARKFCHLKLIKELNLRKHIKPIMVIFSTAIATTLYVSADTTMLGFMVGNYYVGLYSVSTKVYSIVKSILASVLIVSIPRLSFYYAEKMTDKFNNTLTKIFNFLVFLLLPSVTGLTMLSKEIVLLISSDSYIESVNSMRLLSIALIFCLFSWFYSQCILMPMKQESVILKATIISAIANIGLNIIMIPIWKQDAAAFTTIVAEAITLIFCIFKSYQLIKLEGIWRNGITSAFGCIAIVIISIVFKAIIQSTLEYVCSTIVCSVLTYGGIQLLLKNELAWEYVNKAMKKMYKRKY